MAKGAMEKLVNLLVWIAGVLVSLAVGSGMIDGVLSIRLIPDVVVVVAGWIVVVLTIVGVVLAIVDRL